MGVIKLGFVVLVTVCYYPGLCLEVTVCPGEGGCECHGNTINCSGRGLSDVPELPRPISNINNNNNNNPDTMVLLLSNNSITRLDKRAFQGLYISKLELSDNQLGGSVSDQAFTGIVGMTELVMDRCGLTSVPTAVATLEDLTRLSLRENEITSLAERIFSKLTKLKELDLADNRIQFRQQFKSFDNLALLETLDLSRNGLSATPIDALSGLLLLKNLILEENNIRTMSEMVFAQNGNLTTLCLLHNPMQFVHPKALAPLRKLETLEISNSRLTEFNGSNFGNKPNLKRLILSHCTIDSVDATLLHDIVKKLIYLDISGSPSLWNTVRDTLNEHGQNLEVLKLSDLEIEEVPTFLFKSWKNLGKLELRNNGITNLKQWAFEGIRGKDVEIHLEDNNITDINPYLFKETTLPLSLYLKGNVNITSLDFFSENPCAFDRSVVDVSGINLSCSCDTVKVVQKKLVTLVGGFCGEGSHDTFEGLQLTPPLGADSKPVKGVHLEADGMNTCGLENHLTEKYSCCGDEWVTLNTPIKCPVQGRANHFHSSIIGSTLICCILSLFYSTY